MTRERLLLTPGPTPLPASVRAALCEPLLHHREPAFAAVLHDVRLALGRVAGTASEVLCLTTSGTGAFESAYANLLDPGDRVLVVVAGAFGQRWADMGRAFGLEVEELAVPWGAVVDAATIAARVEGRDDLAAVVVVHSETSTGAVCDLPAIAAVLRGSPALLLVDAVSSFAVVPIAFDALGVDVLVSGSQKGLMCPPGIGLVIASPRAWERAGTCANPRFALDWMRARRAQERNQTAFTPPVPLVVALRAALREIEAEGIAARAARVRLLGRGLRAAARALELEIVSPDRDDCGLVTAIRLPPGVDAKAVRATMRDDHGIVVAGGHGELATSVVRFAAFGAITADDLRRGLGAFEAALTAHAGVDPRGVGVRAFGEETRCDRR